jgi:hypothetical protein
MGNDLATVGINSRMQLSPAAPGRRDAGTPGLYGVFFFQSLACAIDLQSRAIDQDVNRPVHDGLAVIAFARWLPRSGPPAQRGVIGYWQTQSHDVKHRTQKPFALAQTPRKHHASIRAASIARSE